MEEGSGAQVLDATGQQRPGTVFGAAWVPAVPLEVPPFSHLSVSLAALSLTVCVSRLYLTVPQGSFREVSLTAPSPPMPPSPPPTPPPPPPPPPMPPRPPTNPPGESAWRAGACGVKDGTPNLTQTHRD